MSPLTPNERQRRIIQLSQQWGIVLPPAPAPLVRPKQPPSFRTSGDDETAEKLMQRRATEVAQLRPKGTIRQAFSSSNLKKGKNWDPRQVVEVLATCISNGGSPGVAEALIAKMAASGFDLGGSQRHKGSILGRRRSSDFHGNRSRLLRLAVDSKQLNMVHVLLPHADSTAIDECLPAAIRSRQVPIIELLLSHDASVSESPDAQDAFRQLCVVSGQQDIIALVLRSNGRPPSSVVSACLCEAAKAGCFENILHLSRSTADGNHNNAEALKSAVASGRKDIALAILMGNHPPQRPGVDEAFPFLYNNSSIDSSTKLELAELLLCAGAAGVVIAQALERACVAQFVQMAKLLAAYGASIEYNEASVLKTAIERGQTDLVESLLRDGSILSSSLASTCVLLISKQASFQERHIILRLLLLKGAHGSPINDILIDAVEAGDVDTVDLLLSPVFQQTYSAHSQETPRQSSSLQGVQHAVASVDHKSGEALRTAVLRGDGAMTQKLLAGQPRPETLSIIFPLTRKLSNVDRYQMVELFLQQSLSGPSLHAALHDALGEDVSQRDKSLIKLLLEYNADVNFDQGSGLTRLIQQRDMELLGLLIQKASPQTAAARMQDVVKLSDYETRQEMAVMLLEAGAAVGTQEMAQALCQVLEEAPIDMTLVRLLLERGSADINLQDGVIVKQAVTDMDLQVLELVFGIGKPSPASVSLALKELVCLPSTMDKAHKFKIIMSRSSRKEDYNWLLVHEVQSILRGDASTSSLSTLQQILACGADPNAFKAASLCHAVIAANVPIVDLLFRCRTPPQPPALGTALPHALRIPDPMDRLTLTKKLVGAGADSLEANRALTHAIATYTEDITLIKTLASAANTSDGEALALSVTKESPDVMDVLLTSRQYSIETCNTTLASAIELKDRLVRYRMCQSLLKAGVSTDMASSALLVAARDGDLRLGDVLMAHGANISSNNGQAIIEACRNGSAEVLRVLLRADGKSNKKTLDSGFQAATEVSDLNKRAEIFELLLNRGISGTLVDSQLESAARSGDDGQSILRVLLQAGADPNHNNGESVVAATRSVFINSLEILLGLWKENGNQIKVSQPTLIRALKASWGLERENRFRVITDLFQAGLKATEDLHITLNDAVNEEDPEERLVRLLLQHGASPCTNGCKTLIDAAQRLAPRSLALLLQREIAKDDVCRAFDQVFTADGFTRWFSEAGLDTAKLLLARGVSGEATCLPLVLVMKQSTAATRPLANDFFDLFMKHEPDVDYNHGELLQVAASKADVEWTSRLLECKPSAQTLSMGFQCIFDTELTQDGVLDLFTMFADYHHDGTRIDVMMEQQGSEPVLVRAIKQYPRSIKILTTLLDAGFYHDQVTTCRIHSEIEDEEETTLLTWAISQPQKRVSTAMLETLIHRGAKVNMETSLSRTTPLMLAIQTKRPDVVKLLLLEDADVDAFDYQGRTPLSMATHIGGDIGVQMMTSLLAAEPSRDDGSLHNAARDLNLAAVKVLVQAGHDADFPSPLHGGRSVLGEVCLHGSDGKDMTMDKERAMQKVMAFLIDSKSDLSVKISGKPLLYLCFDAADAIATTRAFLRSGMWKHVNKEFNYHVDQGFTYSPTMYVVKLVGESDTKDQLVQVLRASRASDVFYANEGPQPEGAIGLPEDLQVKERARKTRLERMAEDSEEFSIAMARKREIADVEREIQAQKTLMEDARRRKLHSEDVAALRSRAQLEESLASAAHARRLSEQRSLAEAAIGRTRALAASELEADEKRQRLALEWESRVNAERADAARAQSVIRMGERHEVERMDALAEQRVRGRIEAQRKLVESQEKLAKRLADGPAASADARRQIGFVTELGSS
ncbi:hypothetical protein CDD81_7196 [Ophiocordyceps australis]|uniref:Uncharacterized protein n=1 Tax=Ophiocordyceps australis TaxID=1399860 RepID=A0A2C5Y4P5_9HYPO|nr:hypothetical protein CDD81_7196 [Ophiocordyceps australis]